MPLFNFAPVAARPLVRESIATASGSEKRSVQRQRYFFFAGAFLAVLFFAAGFFAGAFFAAGFFVAICLYLHSSRIAVEHDVLSLSRGTRHQRGSDRMPRGACHVNS